MAKTKTSTLVRNAIQRRKTKLKKEVLKKGLYENFGQKEVRELEDKYLDWSDYSGDMNQVRDLILAFDEWCMNYEG